MLSKKEQRLRRARQTRIRIAEQRVPRLSVNRTNLHIYAVLISVVAPGFWPLLLPMRLKFAKSWEQKARVEILRRLL